MAPELITALGSIGSGVINAITNNISQRRAIKEQNAYNTPAEQMRRYQAAGLSPNLIYGTGTASAGNQTSLGDYQGVKTSTQDAVNMANAILSLKNIDSNTRKATAEASNAEAQAENTNLDNQTKRVFLLQYQDRLRTQLDLDRANLMYRNGLISLQPYQRMVQLANIRHLNTQSAINDWQLSTGLPATLAISQQNANTAEQNMILGYNRYAFDTNFDQNVNPLNFWNVHQREREYRWTPINNIGRIAVPFISGGLMGTLFRAGKLGKVVKGAGSR